MLGQGHSQDHEGCRRETAGSGEYLKNPDARCKMHAHAHAHAHARAGQCWLVAPAARGTLVPEAMPGWAGGLQDRG